MIPEPILKRPLTWFEQTVPLESCLWFGFCSLEREEQGQATHRQEKAQAKAVWGGGKTELIAMLQVQMAHCFMCGLNGLCQPSYWRHIIWRDHTKTLSTKIQRFINKGHFHDSKCLIDGQDSWSHHEDKAGWREMPWNEERNCNFTSSQKVCTVWILLTEPDLADIRF